MKTYHDLPADGTSRILEQIGAQEQSIDAALDGVRRLVCVGSGKGGVGKSTLTAGLAHALAARGLSCAILDADFNGPSQARLAGLGAAPWLPGPAGLDLPRSRAGIRILSLGTVLGSAEAAEFASVAPNEGQVWRATREFAVFRQLLGGVAWGELDVLLLDLPPGAERTVHFAQVLGERAAFLVATLPAALARQVVARSLTALAARGGRVLGVVENMSGYHCAGCGSTRPLFRSGEVPLRAPLLGRLPFDPAVAELCDAGWTPDGFARLPSRGAWEEVTDRLLETLEISR